MQGAVLTVATATCGLMVGKQASSLLSSDSPVTQAASADPVNAPDLSALVRSGQPVPVEQFFSSPENFAHFLKLTGAV